MFGCKKHVKAINKMIYSHILNSNRRGLGFENFPQIEMVYFASPERVGACGATDNASDYGSEDSRFESWHARENFCKILFTTSENFEFVK